VDVRVVAATHRDLETAVELGAFREDLYYRLRRVVVEVPPLRARREDIPLLVEHVRRQANHRYGLAVEGWTPQARSLLVNHAWRGNVRELQAVVEQAIVLQGSGIIGPDALEFRDARLPRRLFGQRPSDAELRRRLTWSGREALRMVEERQEVRRQELMARCQVTRDRALRG
jgi:DNA-binding NtrC family response regulator